MKRTTEGKETHADHELVFRQVERNGYSVYLSFSAFRYKIVSTIFRIFFNSIQITFIYKNFSIFIKH